MSTDADRPWSDVYEFPSFFDRLEDEGGRSVRDLTREADLDLDGVVYHDRGIRVPGYDATFVREAAGSRVVPAFSVEVDAVGPRSTWAVFDATRSWDVYLLVADDVAAVAWMTDEEYGVEEATRFASKRDAVAAGRFSFGCFLYGDAAWTRLVEQIRRTNAPAYLQHDDGSTYYPPDQPAFYDYVDATPAEFRSGGRAPAHLGLLELEVTIDD